MSRKFTVAPSREVADCAHADTFVEEDGWPSKEYQVVCSDCLKIVGGRYDGGVGRWTARNGRQVSTTERLNP